MPQLKMLLFFLSLAILLAGCKPALIVTIRSPDNDARYFYGSEITFSGSAVDRNGLSPDNESFVWSSDNDGQIGTGKEIIYGKLSAGAHTITLAVTDSQGRTFTAHRHISIITVTAHEVTSATALQMLLNALDYTSEDYPLPISEDIQITGTLTVASRTLNHPQSPFKANFYTNWQYPDSSIVISESGKTLTLSNIVLRFRGTTALLPYPRAILYYIEILPPSDQPCAENEKKCPEDMVCYAYTEYCLHCLGLGQAACSCRDENGLFDNGTSCSYRPLYRDVMVHGTCVNGECIQETSIEK